MRYLAVILLTIQFLVALPDPSYSAIYKWVDANGVITFKDTPPPEGIKGEVISTKASPPITSEPGQKSATATATQKIEQSVEIYTTDWCGYCKQAISFLQANNIPFTEYDIEKDSSAERRKNELDSRPGVPFAIINGKKIHGYSPLAYKDALGMK